jgi:hypothetical protein
MGELSKGVSHGRIGEAAVFAKCWMHGIRAYNTGGLRANFAGSDLIVETGILREKLWVQVKTGAPILKGYVYLTQCAGDVDLTAPKFSSDFVVFVNLETRTAKAHSHDGTLDFSALTYFVVPCADANHIYQMAVSGLAAKPKRDGGQRKLANMAVHVPEEDMSQYKDAWGLLQGTREG